MFSLNVAAISAEQDRSFRCPYQKKDIYLPLLDCNKTFAYNIIFNLK